MGLLPRDKALDLVITIPLTIGKHCTKAGYTAGLINVAYKRTKQKTKLTPHMELHTAIKYETPFQFKTVFPAQGSSS